MIEQIIYDYLNANASVPWYMMRPKQADKAYGLFEKTGSSITDHIYTSTFAFQSYGNSLYEAAQISAELVNIMNDIIILPEVSKSKLTAEYNFTNTADKQHRYQAVFELVHY